MSVSKSPFYLQKQCHSLVDLEPLPAVYNKTQLLSITVKAHRDLERQESKASAETLGSSSFEDYQGQDTTPFLKLQSAYSVQPSTTIFKTHLESPPAYESSGCWLKLQQLLISARTPRLPSPGDDVIKDKFPNDLCAH